VAAGTEQGLAGKGKSSMSRVLHQCFEQGSFRWLCLAALVGVGVGCVEQGEEQPTKEDEEFIRQESPRDGADAEVPGQRRPGRQVDLSGHGCHPYPVEAGKDVRLTHYWKVNVAPGEGWKLFTHISARTGKASRTWITRQ